MSAYFSEPSLGYSICTSGDVYLLKELDASLKANLMSQIFVKLNLVFFPLPEPVSPFPAPNHTVSL